MGEEVMTALQELVEEVNLLRQESRTGFAHIETRFAEIRAAISVM